jgi:hypothetical protein
MGKCSFCANEKAHDKGKHCKSCNLAYMAGRAEALTKAKSLVREIQLQAWEQELERIIGLLEPLGECEPSICGKGCRGEHRCIGWAYRHAIRLIKGDD